MYRERSPGLLEDDVGVGVEVVTVFGTFVVWDQVVPDGTFSLTS